MKGLGERELLRRAEGMEEAYVIWRLASRLYEENLISRENLQACEENLQKEEEKSLETLSDNNKNKLEKLRGEKIRHISENSAEVLFDSLCEKYPNSNFKIIPYNKKGLSEGVQQKADLRVEVFTPSLSLKHVDISLKQYQKVSNPQVASGTYLSTVAGIFFETSGRGIYKTPGGEKFQSKDHEEAKRYFKEYYKIDITPLISLTKNVHKLRYEEYKPKNWKDICTNTGKEAVEIINNLLTEACKNDPNFSTMLKSRILERTGLLENNEKHLFFNFYNQKENSYKTVNTITNKKARDIISELNSKDCIMSFAPNKQSIEFKLTAPEQALSLLVAKMPLTINSNGAWVSKAGFHKKEGIHLEEGQRRPKKSMQLDTSTNFYLDINRLF